MWWIWIVLLIEAVGLLLLWLLLMMAAPRSDEERHLADEAQVRALDSWRASGCRGWVATESSEQGSSVSRRPGPLQESGSSLTRPAAEG
jgi:hypothetical protein